MNLNSDKLPTPLALVVRRLGVAGSDAGAETFLITSYLAEAAIKMITVALYAGLREKTPAYAYRMAYDLVRADGLGTHEAWIRQATSQPLAGFLPPVFNELVAWAGKVRTKPEDGWFREASEAVGQVFVALRLDSPFSQRRPTARDLVAALVQLRNKTRAHGAVGADFFERANGSYLQSVALLLEHCPAFAWRWVHLLRRDNGKNRGVLLLGNEPAHLRDAEVASLVLTQPGVHVWPLPAVHPIPCADLLGSNRECSEFLLPNGGFLDNRGWFIDYATGKARQWDLSAFARPPVPLPPSETQGLPAFDIQSNVFGNLWAKPVEVVAAVDDGAGAVEVDPNLKSAAAARAAGALVRERGERRDVDR